MGLQGALVPDAVWAYNKMALYELASGPLQESILLRTLLLNIPDPGVVRIKILDIISHFAHDILLISWTQ